MKPSRKGEENCRLRKGEEVFMQKMGEESLGKERHSKAEEARRKLENRRILFM